MFRTRDLMVRQCTQLVNTIHGHLAEYGWVAPRGKAHMAMLADFLEEEAMTETLPKAAQPMFKLMTVPGVGRDCGDGDPRTRTAD